MVQVNLSVGETIEYDGGDKSEYNLLSNRLSLDPSLEFYLYENKDNFDKALFVGAGVGVASKILVANDKEVINVEPISSRFNDLENNCSGATNINKACGSPTGDGTMYYFDDNRSGAKLNTNFGDREQAVEVITVDSLNLTDLDLLVITTNGSELEVLQGCTDTIANNPNLKVVISWIPDLMYDIDDKVADLKALSFTSYKIIHWEASDNSITFNNQYTGEFPDDNLKIVQIATVLLE